MVARFMGEAKYYQGFVSERKLEDGSFEMKFTPPYYDYFARWLMMYGKEVEILETSELMGIAASIAHEIADHYSSVFVSK